MLGILTKYALVGDHGLDKRTLLNDPLLLRIRTLCAHNLDGKLRGFGFIYSMSLRLVSSLCPRRVREGWLQ